MTTDNVPPPAEHVKLAIPANDPEILAEVRTLLVWKRSPTFPAEMAQVLVQLRRENAELRAARDAAAKRVGERERAAIDALRGPYRPQPNGFDANGSEVSA